MPAQPEKIYISCHHKMVRDEFGRSRRWFSYCLIDGANNFLHYIITISNPFHSDDDYMREPLTRAFVLGRDRKAIQDFIGKYESVQFIAADIKQIGDIFEILTRIPVQFRTDIVTPMSFSVFPPCESVYCEQEDTLRRVLLLRQSFVGSIGEMDAFYSLSQFFRKLMGWSGWE